MGPPPWPYGFAISHRHRAVCELANAKRYCVAFFARDMLTFADHLRGTLESVPTYARKQAGAALKTLIEGIELTGRDVLARRFKTRERKRSHVVRGSVLFFVRSGLVGVPLAYGVKPSANI